MSIHLQIAEKAFLASKQLLKFSEKNRQDALREIAHLLLINKKNILQANELDLQNMTNKESAMYERLKLSDRGIESMAKACIDIANQEAVCGVVETEFIREDNLRIQKQRIALGVILSIFESRPNVVIDASALAIKSGNAILLKGGKEAKHSNQVLFDIVKQASTKFLLADAVFLIEDRAAVEDLIQAREFIHLVVPRGGQKLVDYIIANSKVPVVAHAKGLCHMFVDESADLSKASEIILNAKMQRPGVCNALESLLLHKNLDTNFVQSLFSKLSALGCELRLDESLYALYPQYKKATEGDWSEEYLEKILSVKSVQNLDEAIAHIQKYSSLHTEAILSRDAHNIEKFLNSLDSSCLCVNASTRFNDGGQLGLGAELGISTTKLHAYGPMGAKEMTISRYLVVGNGHIRT